MVEFIEKSKNKLALKNANDVHVDNPIQIFDDFLGSEF